MTQSEERKDGLLRRIWVPVMAAAVYLGILLWALLQPGPEEQTVSLVHERPNVSRELPYPMELEARLGGERIHTVEFVAEEGFPLERLHRMGFLVDVFLGRPNYAGLRRESIPVESAQLRIGSGDLALTVTADPGELRDHDLLEFEFPFGGAFAEALMGMERPVEMQVSLATRGSHRVALWCQYLEPASLGGHDLGELWIRPESGTPKARGRYYPRGFYTLPLEGENRRRIDLLAGTWRVEATTGRMTALFGGLGVIFVFALFWAGCIPGSERRGLWRAWWLPATGTGVLFLGFGLSYAFMVPPFHAPDEPGHFLSYCALVGDDALAADGLALARAGHLERIKYRHYEHFSADDLREPDERTWAEDISTSQDMRERSAVATGYWRAIHRWLGLRDAGGLLVVVRGLNAMVVAVTVAVAAFMLAAVPERSAGHLLALPLVLAPTLPFFAMHMSNYFLLIACGCVFGAWIVMELLYRRPCLQLVVFVGPAVAVAVFSSRGIFPLAVCLAVLVLAHWSLYWFVPESGEKIHPAVIGVFWGGILIWVVAVSLITTPEFKETLVTYYRNVLPAGAPDWLRGISLEAMVSLGFLVLMAMELAMWWGSRGKLAERVRGAAAAFSPAILLLPIALLANVVYRFWEPPVTMVSLRIKDFESASHYAMDVVRSFWGSFALGAHDFYISTSFWLGFGWLETVPDDHWVGLFCLPFLGGMIAMTIRIFRDRDGARAVYYIIALLALMVYLWVLAIGAFHLQYNLHGRYLLVFYILFLMFAFAGWFVALPARDSRTAAWRIQAVLALSTLVHALCLAFILDRYF